MSGNRVARSRPRRAISIAGLAVAACAAAMLAWAGPAAADNPPQLACGSTQPGPCSQTAHFTSNQGFNTPLPPAGPTNCPAYLFTDFAYFNFTGHGVEHVTVNKAQDSWFTLTFTGTGTVTEYPASSLANIVFDGQGNIVSADIVGPPDVVVTARLTNWFGASFNNKTVIFHDTITVTGTDQNGVSIHVHAVNHTSWNATSTPFVDPPTLDFHNLTAAC